MLHISEIVFLFVCRAWKHRCNSFFSRLVVIQCQQILRPHLIRARKDLHSEKERLSWSQQGFSWHSEMKSRPSPIQLFFVETLWLARPRWKNRALKRGACEVDALRQKASWPMIISLTPGLTTASTHKPLVVAWKQWQCIQDSASLMAAV